MASQYDLPYTGNQVETLLGKVSDLEEEMPHKTSDLTNDSGFITQANVPTNVSELTNDSGFITNAPVTAEQSRAQAAESALGDRIDEIGAKIPSEASSSNQLADKNFVNSSIGTSTATYISNNGEPFTSVAQLNAYTGPHDNNDYAFVVSTDAAGNTVYSRYKYNGSTWAKEYDLNNSSFTSAQWSAINSLMTSAKTQKLDALPTASELATLFSGKQDVISDLATIRTQAAAAYVKPSGGIPKTDLASGVQTSLNKADSAIQDVSNKADKDTDAVEGNVAKFDANGNPVDGGVAMDNVAQKDGSYDTMAVGIAKNLEGRTNVTGSFMERTTGGDAEVANGLAQLNEVRGRSVKFNQLVNDSSVSETVTSNGITFTKSGHIITASGTATGTAFSSNRAVVSLQENHKYYIGRGHVGENNAYVQVFSSLAGNVALSATGEDSKIVTCPSTQSDWMVRIRVANGVTLTNQMFVLQVIDLTAIFGEGNEPETVEDFEAWLAENVGLRYYPYDAGSVLNNKMKGIETLGFNLLDPATGKARIVGAYSDVYGNYYGITGTHGALTFTSDLGETSTITPDSDGKFLIETPGWLSVATPGADCAVFLWWDGTKTEYEEYERNEAPLDVTHIYGKLNGAGNLVQVWPTGMPGIGDIKDSLKIVDGAVVAERKCGEVNMGTLSWRVHSSTYPNTFVADIVDMNPTDVESERVKGLFCGKYAVNPVSKNTLALMDDGSMIRRNGKAYVKDTAYSDAATFKTAVTGTLLYYELATPRVYTDLVYQGSDLFANGTPVTLPVNYTVNNWSIERILPQNTSEAVVTSAPELSCRYSIDAIETMNTHADEIENLYDGLDELDEKKPDKNGEYPLMSVGTAQNIKGENVVAAEYTFRKTPDGAATGIAAIERLKGKSLVWNQLVPFDGWKVSSATKTINGAEITVTKSPNVGTGSGMLKYSNKVIAGHKYLYSSESMTTESVEVIMWLGMNVSGKRLFSGAALTAWTKYVSIIEAPADVPDDVFFVIYIRTATGENTLSVKVKNVQVIDLTLMFGAGNEPATVAEFEALFPLPYYAYNAGTLINNKAEAIEATGFNQWDEEWESGTVGISNNMATKVVSSTQIRTKNWLRVLPGQVYKCTCLKANYGGFYVIGASSLNDLGYGYTMGLQGLLLSRSGGETFTVPSWCHYILFSMAASYGTAYNHDICINLSDTSRNGTYEPYRKETLELNVTTLTGKLDGEGESVTIAPDGLKSAGAAYDYGVVENGYLTKIVKRIGVVDMGTLTYTKTSGNYFYAPLTVAATFTGNSVKHNLLSNRYVTKTQSDISGSTEKIIAGYYTNSTNRFYVNDPDYASGDADAFKSGVTGVPLYYELATPLTYVLDTPIPMQYAVVNGGTEMAIPTLEVDANGVPKSAPIAYDVRYALDAVKVLSNLPVNYISKESMQAFLTTLGTAMGGTWTMTYNSTTGKYEFGYTPSNA